MAIPKSVVTETELSVLKALWSESPLSAREIAQRIYRDASASSVGTVQKLISRLEEKGMLDRDNNGSPHRFSPRLTQEDIAGMQLNDFARKLSGGSLSPFVMHLVQAKSLSKAEKEEIRRLLDES